MLRLTIETDNQGRLSVQPASAIDDDLRQFIRTNKDALASVGAKQYLFMLPADVSDTPPQEQEQRHWGWLLHYDNGEVVERYIIPEPTHAEVMSFYPNVIAAEPVDNPAPVVAANTPVRDELLRELVSGHDDMVRIFAPDDRRTCKQCLNLRFNVCVVAAPSSLALVVANKGYRPNQVQPHRCKGYTPQASDKDQRTGEERWPNLN